MPITIKAAYRYTVGLIIAPINHHQYSVLSNRQHMINIDGDG